MSSMSQAVFESGESVTEHSAELGELGKALAKAQAAVRGARKDSANPFFKSSYADLASVWEACREALTSNGLSVVQLPGFENGIATVETMLLHSSGQWISGKAGAPLGKQDAQGVGSVITYLRRYALQSVAGVAAEDDDGNAAVAPAKQRRNSVSPGGGSRVISAPLPQAAAPTESLNEKPRAIVAAETEKAPWEEQQEPLKWKNKKLTDFTSDELITLRDFCEKKDGLPGATPKYGAYLTAIEEILESRRGE